MDIDSDRLPDIDLSRLPIDGNCHLVVQFCDGHDVKFYIDDALVATEKLPSMKKRLAKKRRYWLAAWAEKLK